ncbi:MAG TPA: hypothetical protein VFZ08_12810 [Terriglobia bacterium]|nr:hypothetical protein [Terriglobia bacterium]
MKSSGKIVLGCLILAGMFAGLAAGAPQTESSSKGPEVRMTVTVVRHNQKAPHSLAAADVLVYQNKERRPVVSWSPSSGHPQELAILIDDSLASSFGVQIQDLKKFITGLPASMRVAVVYATHGNSNVRQDFTSDHAKAANALRLPVGRANEGSSIYMAVTDFVKHWPEGSSPRNLLVISDGIDLYRGVMDSQPGLNPDLQQAVEAAQRKSVTVYTLFADTAGLRRRNLFLVNNGQGSLSLLTLETGGQSFFQGLQTPISFQPYLQQFTTLLGEQYLLTFQAQPIKKAGLEPVRVTTEQPGIELLAPVHVYVP